MPNFEFKLRSAIGVFLSICLFSVSIAEERVPGLAPNDGYIETPLHPSFATPPGRYHTHIAWLMASQVAFENQSAFERGWLNGAMAPGLYHNYMRDARAVYAGLEGRAHYLYAEALLRDVAQMQLVTLQNNQMSIALGTVPVSIISDAATMVISAGVSQVIPKVRAGIQALESRYIQAEVGQDLIARSGFIDMELRYSGLVDSAVFQAWKEQMAAGVSAADLTKLMSESVMSASIGTAINAYRGSPDQLLEVFRTQLVMDVAAYKCACVLDLNTHRIAGATDWLLGSTGNYRTGLGWILAQRLAPPDTGLIGWAAELGGTNASILNRELSLIAGLKQSNPARYGTYMRSLLVDLETLERAMIAGAQTGATMAFLETTVMNVLFGAVTLGGGLGGQAVAALANAGYGAMSAYQNVGTELKIRMQVAALREQVLDNIRPDAEICGCGAGVAVVPRTTVIGDTPNN